VASKARAAENAGRKTGEVRGYACRLLQQGPLSLDVNAHVSGYILAEAHWIALSTAGIRYKKNGRL
jgi:hypothetical protein